MKKIMNYLLLILTSFLGFREVIINSMIELGKDHIQTLLILMIALCVFSFTVLINILGLRKNTDKRVIAGILLLLLATISYDIYPSIIGQNNNVPHLNSQSILIFTAFSLYCSFIILIFNNQNEEKKRLSY